VVPVDPHEALRRELLEHLSEGPDIAQRTRRAQAHVRLVSLRLEVVEAVSDGNERSLQGTDGRGREQAAALGNGGALVR
jgi:hypothetical protein